MSTDGVLGAVWLPTDGWLDPSGLAMALAAGARAAGRDDPDEHPRRRDRRRARARHRGRPSSTDGSRETIAAEVVVNAGGMFAPEIGRLAGVTIPIIPMAHQYLFTEAIEGVHAGLPQLRDPDNLVYFREEVGGLCMGGYERDPAPWSLDGVPPDFNGKLLAPDWPRFEEIMAGAVRRVPAIADAGVVADDQRPGGLHAGQRVHPRRERRPRVLRRRRASAPTGSPAPAGSAARSRAGSSTASPSSTCGTWTSGGSAASTGGRAMDARPDDRGLRDLLRHPLPERGAPGRPAAADVADVRAARGPSGRRSARSPAGSARTGSSRTPTTRGSAGERRSSGSGRAAGPASTGARRSRAEALATRIDAGLFDETSFAKIEVVGPGAVAFLDRMAANDVDVPVGRDRLHLAAEQPRRDRVRPDDHPDRAAIASSSSPGRRSASTTSAGSGRTCPDDGSVQLNDLTSGRVCYGLWGPRARDILAPLTTDDLSNAAFPYLTARADHASGRCPSSRSGSRTSASSAGSCMPTPSSAPALWDTLLEAGRPHGLTPAGYRAIDALRLEKGYRVWSTDITPDETPFEAGLGFAVALDKPGGFIGRDALVAREGGRAAEAAALPGARRPALGLPRQRARPGRRAGSSAG